MVQRVCDARLQEAQPLYGDGKVVIVPREIFTRFRTAISFSLRRQPAAYHKIIRLTIRPVAYSAPQAFGEHQAFFELVDAFAHGEEPLVGFAHAGEGVEEGVGDAVYDAGVFGVWWVRNVLVHVNVL